MSRDRPPLLKSQLDERERSRLAPREVYVMNRTPIVGRGERRTGRTVWMLESEDLSRIVERLLARGLLAAGPGWWRHADLTDQGRAALAAHRPATV